MTAAIPELTIGQKFSSSSQVAYRVIQRLGFGGNSHVYLTEAISGETRGILFALKLFVNIEKAGRQTRFEQEIKFLKQANHPSIMRIYDDGVYPVQDGTNRLNYPFVVAEYLPTTLRDIMQRQPRMIEKISYSLQLLSGLAYLNMRNPPVVHRDIKPENIFVRGPACILGDFGLMKLLVSQPTDQADREFMVESHGPRLPRFYRSPDLVSYCRGELAITTKSDVFQTGLVLAELFTGENPLVRCDKILDPVKLSKLLPIPGSHGQVIGSLIESMLESEIDRRPSAEDLIDRWEGTFLNAAGIANSLDGKVF